VNKTALILVDIQKDFLPGGAFAIPNGDVILPVINQLASLPFDNILASKDWHPQNHVSFAINHNKSVGEKIIHEYVEQILWPVHCVQESPGAEFAEGSFTTKILKSFLKGTDTNIDSYSTFFDNQHKKSTGLSEYLKKRGINELYIAGLATDYCVKYSVLDAINLGFDVFVVKDACHGIDLHSKDSEKALAQMVDSGAILMSLQDVSKRLCSKE